MSCQIENMRQELLHSIRQVSLGAVPAIAPPPSLTEPEASQNPHLGSHSAQSASMLASPEMELMKREIISSLRTELREMAREIANANSQASRTSPNIASLNIPSSSELYHTHLYTQL